MAEEEEFSINKVDRSFSSLQESFEQDDFVKARPEILLGFIWDLTKEVYSLRDGMDVERRLQRDVANLIRQ